MRPQIYFALLVFLVAGTAVAADRPQPHQVTVAARDYRFSPARLVLQRGVRYRLHVVNRGTVMHEFHAPEFFAASRIRNPGVLNADRTEIVLPPGTAKDLDVTPEKTGHFKLICPDHAFAGMTGDIIVR